MTLKIEIELDNAAFEDETEAKRILANVAKRLPFPLESTMGPYRLHDANGNHVGHYEITEETSPV